MPVPDMAPIQRTEQKELKINLIELDKNEDASSEKVDAEPNAFDQMDQDSFAE